MILKQNVWYVQAVEVIKAAWYLHPTATCLLITLSDAYCTFISAVDNIQPTTHITAHRLITTALQPPDQLEQHWATSSHLIHIVIDFYRTNYYIFIFLHRVKKDLKLFVQRRYLIREKTEYKIELSTSV